MAAQPPHEGTYADDEISLVDLARVLHRRRRTMAVVGLVTFAAAAAWSQIKPERFEFLSVVELGTWEEEGELRHVESPALAVEQLNQVIIPSVWRELPPALREQAGENTVKARRTDGGEGESSAGLVTLAAEAGRGRSEVIAALQNGAAQRLQERLDDRLSRTRNELELQRNAEKREEAALEEGLKELEARKQRLDERHENALLALEEQEQLVSAELQRLKEREELTQQRISRHEELVDEWNQRYEVLLAEVAQTGDETIPDLTHHMLLDSLGQQVIQHQQRLADLQDVIRLKIPEKRSQLEQRLQEIERNRTERILEHDARIAEIRQERADTRRSIEEVEAEVGRLTTQLDSVSSTRVVLEPGEPTQPVGAGTSLIVALGAVLGAMLGLFSAFFHEFISRVRETNTLDEME